MSDTVTDYLKLHPKVSLPVLASMVAIALAAHFSVQLTPAETALISAAFGWLAPGGSGN